MINVGVSQVSTRERYSLHTEQVRVAQNGGDFQDLLVFLSIYPIAAEMLTLLILI